MSNVTVDFGLSLEIGGVETDATFKATVWNDRIVEIISAVWDGDGTEVPDKVVDDNFDDLFTEAHERAADKLQGLYDAHWNSKILARKEGER